jgi:hypothetical protein
MARHYSSLYAGNIFSVVEQSLKKCTVYAIAKFYKCEIACKTVCKILFARAGEGAVAGVGMQVCVQACVLLACRHASYVVYANALRYMMACNVFLYMKIFVCLIKQASLLAIISKLGGGLTLAFYG